MQNHISDLRSGDQRKLVGSDKIAVVEAESAAIGERAHLERLHGLSAYSIEMR